MIEQTVVQPSVLIPVWSFSQTEWSTLQSLKTRYQLDRGLFDSIERAHLEFVRWLYRNGYITP